MRKLLLVNPSYAIDVIQERKEYPIKKSKNKIKEGQEIVDFE